jgi:hypothetical protein
MEHIFLAEVLEIVPILRTTEARTVFMDTFQLTMPHDLRIGVIDLQRAE